MWGSGEKSVHTFVRNGRDGLARVAFFLGRTVVALSWATSLNLKRLRQRRAPDASCDLFMVHKDW